MAQALTLQPSSCNMSDTSLAKTTRKRHSRQSNKHLALLVANMLKKAIQANRVDTDHNPKAQLTMRQCKLWALALIDVFTNPRFVRARMLHWRAPNDSKELKCSRMELLSATSAECSADCAPPPSGSQLTQDMMGLRQLLHQRALEHEQEHEHMTDLIRSHAMSVAADVWGGEVAVKIYGSRAVGMALPDSDIDVALLPSVRLNSLQQTQALTMLAGQLLESGGWSSGRVISGHTVTLTAVPVLKLVMEHGFAAGSTLPLRVMLDVTLANHSTTDQASSIDGSTECSNHVGLHGIDIVNRLKTNHEALAPVVMFLKQLLVTSNLNDPYSGGLGSYALTLMVAFVMQRAEAKGECCEAGELLRETLQYYANSFNPLKDCVRPLPHSEATPNGSTKIEPGSSTTPLQVFDPEYADMNVAASSFRFNLVQHLFGWVHSELSKHYSDTADVSPQLGVLLEIVTRKHDALY